MRAQRGLPVEITHNALRVVAGLMFWQHGVQKLLGGLGAEAQVQLFSIMGLAGVIEMFGGLLVIVGLFTRPVAFIAAGEMAVAYFWRHAPEAFWPIQNGGERAVLFCFIFLYLFTAGAGKFSLDRWLAVRRERSREVGPGPASGRAEPDAPGAEVGGEPTP